jgi:ERF superfamily
MTDAEKLQQEYEDDINKLIDERVKPLRAFVDTLVASFEADLAERAEARGNLEAEFDDAFSAAQAKFGVIERNRTVKVKSKSTGVEYDFKYAELSTILAACRPALNAEGISFRQFVRIKAPTEHVIVTQLRRKGFKLEDEFPINLPQSNHPQDYGAAVSYAKRLGGQATLGVVGEDDNDLNTPDDMRGAPESRHRGVKGRTEAGRQAVHEATQAAAFPKTVEAPAPKPQERPLTDREMADLEAKLMDLVQDMTEACYEGRRVGIEQIWNEAKGNEFLATRLWSTMKEKHPDYFATMEETLRPKSNKGPRGPKPPAPVQGKLA